MKYLNKQTHSLRHTGNANCQIIFHSCTPMFQLHIVHLAHTMLIVSFFLCLAFTVLSIDCSCSTLTSICSEMFSSLSFNYHEFAVPCGIMEVYDVLNFILHLNQSVISIHFSFISPMVYTCIFIITYYELRYM